MKHMTILCLATLCLAAAPKGMPLTIEVSGITPGRGQVMVGVCRKNEFLSAKCTFQTAVPAGPGRTVVVVASGLSRGRYAVQVVYDLNRNYRMDTTVYGAPNEPVGFSRNPAAVDGPPRFEDAAFDLVTPTQMKISVK